jgi:trk system potassium uptake protein TrkA
MQMKRVIVIGLGIFGYNVVRELHENNVEVFAIDKKKEAVQAVRDFAARAIVADGTDKDLMDSIGIREDDMVIVSFGEDLAASTLITLHLRQMKVKDIIVKAPNEEHKLILEKVGATEVIIPEKEMADKIVKGIVSPNVPDYIPLSEDYMICEIATPKSFVGKTLGGLKVRSNYNIGVIAIRDTLTDRVEMVPSADFVFKDSDVIVVVGKEADIDKIR